MRSLIRSATFTGYAPLAAAHGVDAIALFAEAGINPGCLHDPDLLINADSVAWIYEETARRADMPDFGLQLAEARNVAHLGDLALILTGEPTLRAVIGSLARYLRLHNEGINVTLDEATGTPFCRLDFITGSPRRIRQSAELTLAVIVRSFRALLGAGWRPLLTCFIHDRPDNLATHHRIFGPDIAFGTEFTGVLLEPADLDRPLGSSVPALSGQIRRYLDRLLGDAGPGFEAKVHRLVHMLLPMGRCTVERVADHLGVDRRTVHRHLAADGTTFTRIVDDARAELAIRFLESESRPLAEVADLLGFAALSGFSRWFAHRFGMTASAWRRENLRPRGLP